MCLILLAFRAHERYPLIVAANRDEHHHRPAAAAAYWDDHPQIYGGRDLEKGGTWMGITRTGRFAAITNYRDGLPAPAAPRSRGALVSGFLTGEHTAQDFAGAIAPVQDQYGGFGLIAGDMDTLMFCSNRGASASAVTPGIHGLSNHLLDTPWPKIRRGTAVLQTALASPDEAALAAALFDMLGDRTAADDKLLPDTGVPRQRERELSPAFICGEHYGTRTSTVMLVQASGDVLFHEKRYGPDGLALDESAARFTLITGAGSATG